MDTSSYPIVTRCVKSGLAHAPRRVSRHKCVWSDVYMRVAAPRAASHAPASAAQAACCAPHRYQSSFATERKLVRSQATTRARATPPAPAVPLPSIPQPPPSSRHESPHALLNTRWRVMRRGTDAPPLLRACSCRSFSAGTALAQTSHTPRLPQPLVQLMKPCQPFAPRDIRSHGLPRDIRPALHDRALRALGQPRESCGRARGAGGAGGPGGRGRCGVSWRG